MNRRRFLAGASLVLPAAVAGCLTGGTDADDGDQDSVPVLTGHEVSDHVARADAERNSDMDAWGLFVASRDAAEAFYGDVDEDVRAFVDETDFEAGDRLVYLEAYAPQTCYEMTLAEDPYVAENGVPTVETAVDRLADDDEPCGDAMTPVDVLLRLSFDLDGGSTDVLEARVAGHRDQPEELTLEAER